MHMLNGNSLALVGIHCITSFAALLTCTVTFPNTSVTVHWSVFGGSRKHAANETVGTATNGFEFFWMFKDDGQFLYKVDNWTCYSMFWAY